MDSVDFLGGIKLLITNAKYLKKIVKENSRIYVCSPLSANTKGGIQLNMLSARDKCNYLNGMFKDTNVKVWASHSYLPMFLNDNVLPERELAIKFGMELLSISDILYVFGDKISSGMKNEIMYAISNNIPIVYESNVKHKLFEFLKEE